MSPKTTLFVYLSWCCGLCLFAAASTSSSQQQPPPKVLASLQPPGWGLPDPFVQAAPLVVAVSCRDGIVFVAAHNPEPLQQQPNDDTTQPSHPYYDSRIHSIGTHGTVMVPCGWRADGIRLVERARAVVRNQTATFGDEHTELPWEMANYMARCAGQASTRTLSCAALLAMPPSTENNNRGTLWLVDMTGAYPVRAHCLGGGFTSTQDSSQPAASSTAETVSRALAELLHHPTTTASYCAFDMSTDEALRHVLLLLQTNDSVGSTKNGGSAIELVTVDYPSGRIQRRTVDDFLPAASKTEEEDQEV